MRNLKNYKLEKLESLPTRLGMHKHYTHSFELMNGWDSNREYHGDWIWPRLRATIRGSVGRTKAQIAERIKLWWPKNYWRTVENELEHHMDYRTKMVDDVLMFTSDYRRSEKQYLTLEELVEELEAATSYYWRRMGHSAQYYFDNNNVLCTIAPTRRAKERMPRKEYYEKVKADRKDRRIRNNNEELLRTMSWSFMSNVDTHQAYTMLRRAWNQAQKDVVDYTRKYEEREGEAYWHNWFRYMARESAKKLKLLTADMNALRLGDHSVLEVYLKQIRAKRETEAKKLLEAA